MLFRLQNFSQNMELLTDFEEILIHCDIDLSFKREEYNYYNINLPLITTELLRHCGPAMKFLEHLFKGRKRFKHVIYEESAEEDGEIASKVQH